MSIAKSLTCIALAGLLLWGSGCDMAEIREDPNNPADAPENLQLTSLLSYFSYEVIANDAVRIPSQWIQQTAFNGVPPTEDNYDVDESDVNNLWEFYSYTDVMNNARILIETAEANQNYSYAAIAKTLLAWNLAIVTDLWGAVPWSQAFQVEDGKIIEAQPTYDSQEQIYQAVFDLLGEALADYDRGDFSRSPGADDIVYGGNLDQWKKLTNTVLARQQMHLTQAPGNSAADRAQQALAAVQNGFTSNADNAEVQYFNKSGEENPWYQWVIDSKWDTRNQLSVTYVNLLKSRRDPRLPVQARQVGAVDASGAVPGFQPVPFDASMFDLDDPTYVGHVNGENGIGETNISSIGTFYSAPDAPLTWISYAEAKFIEAEATLITSGAAAADPIYRDAIRASMENLGVAEADIEEYLAARPALASEADPLGELMIEKYIANFLILEAYNDWRRNGYPELDPVLTQVPPGVATGIIPLRFPYPDSELSRNASNVAATGVPLGYGALDVPVWWDTTN
jgi:hypothetical protein